MKSNYAFLNDHFPELAMMGSLAEDYLYSDGNSCLIKLGLFAETMVNLMMDFDEVAPPEQENTHANRIRALKREGLIAPEIDDVLYALRKTRNDAVQPPLGLHWPTHEKWVGSPLGWFGKLEDKPFRNEVNNYDSMKIPLLRTQREKMQRNYDYYGASGIIESVEDFICRTFTI